MTGSGWLAIGAGVAALLAPDVGALVVGLSAGGVALALAAARASDGGRPVQGKIGLRAGLPVALGALVLALRVLVGGGSDPNGAAVLTDDRGPWLAIVETRGSNREGQQVATVQIISRAERDGPEGSLNGSTTTGRRRIGPWQVMATLPRYPQIEPGQVITLDGSVEAPPDGPYGDYLARIGVVGTVRSRSMTIDGRLEGPSAMLERLRRGAGDALTAAIPEPEAGLAAGIVIGLRDRVDRTLAADFTTVGASHVVAISGWNIAIVAATVAALAGRFGRRRRALVMVPVILLYVLFAGASPSVVRAAAMAGVVLLARETGRAGRAAAALGWAAAILLAVEPSLILDAGFQLSTLATAGILAWADPLERRLRAIAGGRLPGWFVESLAVSLAAQAATLPIVVQTFGRLAVISPLINLAIVPFVAPAMAAALVALVGGALVLAGGPAILATLAGLPAWALLTLICTIVRAGASLPFASLTIAPPWATLAALAMTVVPLAVVLARRRRRKRRPKPSSAAAPTSRHPRATTPARGRVAVLLLAVAVGGLGLAIAHRADGVARITVLDVGQGDAILVEGGGGGRMLVDGGPDPDRLIVELDRRLPPWDRRIDILVLTHPHEDHVAGLPLILERYRVGRIYESGMRGRGPGYAAFSRDVAGRPARPVGTLATGARIGLDAIRLSVLWPDPGRVPREPPDAGRSINNASIVLLGEVAGRRFLLTGDVEDDVDPILAERGLPPIDILKVAHHGSATASTAAFLGVVRPRLAIVSSGTDNRYGHPARSTVDRLAGTGARVMRTDTDGSVTITFAADGAFAVASSGQRRAALRSPSRVAAGGFRGSSIGPPAGPIAASKPVAGGLAAPIGPVVPTFACRIPSSG